MLRKERKNHSSSSAISALLGAIDVVAASERQKSMVT